MRIVFMLAVAAGATLLPGPVRPAEPPAKPTSIKTPPAKKAPPVPRPLKPDHRMQCTVGEYAKQVRFVMQTNKGKPIYVAWWSSNGPFHCSFESRREDGRWADSAAGTTIALRNGSLLIERQGDFYNVRVLEVDRMTHCGTEGAINGTLVVPRIRGVCTWTEPVPPETAPAPDEIAPAPVEPAAPTL